MSGSLPNLDKRVRKDPRRLQPFSDNHLTTGAPRSNAYNPEFNFMCYKHALCKKSEHRVRRVKKIQRKSETVNITKRGKLHGSNRCTLKSKEGDIQTNRQKQSRRP